MGQKITTKRDGTNEEILRRIRIGWNAFEKLTIILKSDRLLKWPTITWALTKLNAKKNIWIGEKSKVQDILQKILNGNGLKLD